MARGGATGTFRAPLKAERERIPVAEARNGSDLCLQCGLCCDGTVFHQIGIQADDPEFLESLGLPVEPDPDSEGASTVFEPCVAFVDGCCSLYERGRPQSCSTYRCRLLDRYTEGQNTLDDNMATVQLVWSLVRELEAEMGLPLDAYNRRALLTFLAERRPWEAREQYATFLVTFHRLDRVFDHYFAYNPYGDEVKATEAGAEIAAANA